MSPTEPFTPIKIEDPEQPVVPTATAETMERTNRLALWNLKGFTADEINLFRFYFRMVKKTVTSILGETVDPKDMSHLIQMREELRKLEAANDENYRNKAENGIRVPEKAANDEAYNKQDAA